MAYDAYDKLIVLFNGADGATTYTAETGETVSFSGTAQIDTGTGDAFGGNAGILQLDGNSDYVSVPADVDYCAFSTGDLTVSVRIKRMGDGDNDEEYILSNYDGGGTNSWAIIYSRSGKTIMFYNFTTSNGCRFSVDLSADTNWHIIEFCRSGTSWYPFFDGILKTPNYDTIAGESVGDSTKRLSSGCLDPAVPARFWNGFIDEIHISKGVARHTSGYTVPTAEYLNTSIKNVSGVAYSSIKKISNIAIASVKKCSGVA